MRGGAEAKRDGGISLLNAINRDTNIIRPTHILGLTEYTDILEEYSQTFDNQLWHLIEYNGSSSEWSQAISEKLMHIIGTKDESEDNREVDLKQLYGVGIFIILVFVMIIGTICVASKYGGGFWRVMGIVVASFVVLTVLAIIGRFMGVFSEGTVVRFLDSALHALRLGIGSVKSRQGSIDGESREKTKAGKEAADSDED